jgi:hypothetical protein
MYKLNPIFAMSAKPVDAEEGRFYRFYLGQLLRTRIRVVERVVEAKLNWRKCRMNRELGNLAEAEIADLRLKLEHETIEDRIVTSDAFIDAMSESAPVLAEKAYQDMTALSHELVRILASRMNFLSPLEVQAFRLEGKLHVSGPHGPVQAVDEENYDPYDPSYSRNMGGEKEVMYAARQLWEDLTRYCDTDNDEFLCGLSGFGTSETAPWTLCATLGKKSVRTSESSPRRTRESRHSTNN